MTGAGTPAATAPGRAARVAYFEVRGAAHLIDPWDQITELDARAWEAAAQAAIEAAQVADDADMRAEMDDLRERAEFYEGERDTWRATAEVINQNRDALEAERDRLTGRVAELVTEGNELLSLLGKVSDALLEGGQDDASKARKAIRLISQSGLLRRACEDASLSGSPDGGAGREAS